MQLSGNSGTRSGQFSKSARVILPITTVAYASGQVMGGLILFPQGVRLVGEGASITKMFVIDRSSQKARFHVLFFDALPTLATLTDHSPFSFSGDDVKCAARVSVYAADWVTTSLDGLSASSDCDAYIRNNENSLFLYAVVIAAAPAHYASASDLTFVFSFAQD
jgi:hypothetical protein